MLKKYQNAFLQAVTELKESSVNLGEIIKYSVKDNFGSKVIVFEFNDTPLKQVGWVKPTNKGVDVTI